jgi:hypothetical protein
MNVLVLGAHFQRRSAMTPDEARKCAIETGRYYKI